MAPRIALRKPAVLKALGYSKSTFHAKINRGLILLCHKHLRR